MKRRHLPSLAAMQCFEAAARHLSFTRAADELSMTQSAVSKQVAQLESVVENSLFRRVRRRLQLTPEGALYLTEVRRLLAQVDMSTRYMLSHAWRSETLNVCTLPTLGARWLIPRLNGFRYRHPEITLNITNRTEPFDLVSERVDVAFFYGNGNWPGTECLRLLDEVVIPVCSPAIMPAQALDSALDLTPLVLLQSVSRPEAWHDWFELQGLYTPHSYHGPRFDTFYMTIRAARAGCGVALTPAFLVEEDLANGSLIVPWDYPMTHDNGYYMAWPEPMGEMAKVRVFIDWILEHSASGQSTTRQGT